MGNNQNNSSSNLSSWVDWLFGGNQSSSPAAASGETRHEAESTSTKTTSSPSNQTQHSQDYKNYVNDVSETNEKNWPWGTSAVCGGKKGKEARDTRNDSLPESEAYISRRKPDVDHFEEGDKNTRNAVGLLSDNPVPGGCFEKIQVPSSISGHRQNFGGLSGYDFTSSSYTSGLTGSGSSALFSASGSNRYFLSLRPSTVQEALFSGTSLSKYNK